MVSGARNNQPGDFWGFGCREQLSLVALASNAASARIILVRQDVGQMCIRPSALGRRLGSKERAQVYWIAPNVDRPTFATRLDLIPCKVREGVAPTQVDG